MSGPLLLTKLFIPRTRPELVPRPRLIAQLDHGLHHKLTLISAPAGFGKTTVVTEWLNTLQRDSHPENTIKIAWYSLDSGDNDPKRFLTYVISALIQIYGPDTIGEGSLTMLESPQPPSSQAVLTSLINEIAIISEKVIFVLDDYHLIDNQPVHDALAFLLDNLPPQLHMVISTREDPPMQMSRLRGRGQMTEIRAIDLRFTAAETAQFMNRVMGLNLSLEDIATLDTRTEGWIAGLQLAALAIQGQRSIQGHQDASRFIETFSGSNRFILDYLIEEILDKQPENICSFLLQTALLDQFTGPLCDALTDQDTGQQTLDTLERANLFIVPLDKERRWYRYHHLFGDLLFQRLRQTQAEKIPDLHVKAGEWFNQQGMKRDAIKHSLAGRNYSGAAEMIQSIGIDLMLQGEHTTVEGWINALPEERIIGDPFLCTLHAWALQLTGQLEAGEARLVAGENAMDRQENQSDKGRDGILGLINFRRAYSSFMVGKLEKTIAYATQALAQLPEAAVLSRAHAGLYLGVAYRYQGLLQQALETYNKILPLTERMGGKSIAVLHHIHLSDVYWLMGELERAQELCEHALSQTERHRGRPDMPFCGFAYVRSGRILRQRNQLQESYQLTQKGLALCRDWNVADILALSYIELAYISQALGNDDQAHTAIQEAIRIMDSFSPWGSKIAAAHQAKMDLARGNLEAAQRWAQTNELTLDGEIKHDREIDYLTWVRLFIVQKQYGEAQTLARRIYKIACEAGKGHTVLETQILLALIHFAKGDTDQALRHLEGALTIAEPEGFMRIFVDEGPPMAKLLYESLSREMASGYVQKLVAAFPVEKPESIHQTHSHDSDLIEPLSERELEVLRLIAEGISRQEIASQLVISLNTVKTHARNVYSKLGVNNQMQAVGKARALGLLENE